LKEVLFANEFQEQREELDNFYRILNAENNNLIQSTKSLEEKRITRDAKNSKNLSGLIEKALKLVNKVESIGKEKKKMQDEENFFELKSLLENQNLKKNEKSKSRYFLVLFIHFFANSCFSLLKN
jgi:hypothetical protein